MKQSIANLVADVKRATHTMTKDFDSVVDHINAKFKELGNGKNVSAKGGVSANATKQSTQAVEENTNARKKNAQAVSVASDAVTKETQKLQTLQQSLSGASNREQEFVNKKQQAATVIAQENELLGKQQSELSALKAQQQQYNDAVRNQTNAVSSAEQKLKDAQQKRIDLESKRQSIKNDATLAALKEEYKALSDLIAVAEKYKSVFAKMKDEDMSKMQGKFGWKSWGGLSDAEKYLKDAYSDNRQAKWAKEGILSLDDEKVKAAIERVNMGILQAAKENYSRAIFDKIKNENWGAKDISSWIATMQSRMQKVVQSNRESGIDSRIDEEYQAYKHIIGVLKEYLQYAEKVGQERKKLAESSVAVSTAMKNATTHDNVLGSMTNLDSRQFSLITSQMAREKEIKDKLLANDNQLTEAKNKEAEATQALSVEKKKLNDLEQQQVQATQQSAQASQQKATIDSQIAAKEAEIAATKGRISTATQSQSEAEKAAAAASKEKATIQTQVSNQEKALVEAKKQLTTATQRQAEVEKQSVQATAQQASAADKQIKKNQEVSMSFDQMAKAQHEAFAAQQSKRYGTSELQNLRMEQHRIEAELSKAQSTQTSNPAFLKALEETRTRLHELARLRSELESKPILNASEAKNLQYIRSEYERVNNLMRELSQQKSAGFTIPNDMTEKIVSLRNEYDRVKKEINAIGQALIDADFRQKVVNTNLEKAKELEQENAQGLRGTTNELNRQLRLIGEIQDKKSATKAFEQISLMPSNTMEEIQSKGKALFELVKKVKDTPLMSQTNVKLAEKMVGSLANQYRALKAEKEKVAKTTTTNPAVETTTRRSLEQEKRDLEELKARQKERTQEIINTGIAAQNTARKVTQSINAQMQTADYTKPVEGVKDLQNAIYQMQNALKQPLDSGIRAEMEKTLQIAREILHASQRYNMTVSGLGSVGVGGKAPTDTLAAYSAEAQRLEGIYRNLSKEERNAAAGKGLIDKYQQLQRTSGQVRKELERPVDLNAAMKGSEKTLDDIACKMQKLQLYKQGIDLTNPNAAKEMQEVNKALEKFQKEMDKYMSKSKEVNATNTALGRSWNYMKNRLAFYFTVGATTQFVKSLVDIRGQYELLERSIGILVDSAQNGSRIFAELNAMAIKSPFTTMELGAAAKQLVAYDVAAKDVVDTTKRLADMAAAVGVPIERLTYALGQIKSYNYLNARDARMFANTGIPLVKNLADMYTKLEGRLVSTSDVYDRIKKKAVSYNDVMRVVNEMTDEGGKFFNFQEKAADTLKVKIANLSLAYNNMLNEMGKTNQGVISGGLVAFKTLMEHWRDVENTILALIPAYGAAKIAQLLLYKAVNKTTMATAAQAVFSEKLVAKWQAVTVAAKGATAASIGVSLATAGVLALVAVLGKLAWDYHDLKKANEEFNKSVIDGAEENIQSISKFFDDYKKELKEISGASSSDQNKMWERMQEEIEKTVSNAQDYIDILEKIDDTASRIKAGEAILGQQQVIEQEIKDFASRGMLDLGGGFADDSMAKDLEEYDKWAREFTANFDKMTEQSKKNVGLMLQTYAQNTKEVDAEIDKFIGKLQSLNFEKIMGDFDKQTQFANIRNAVSSIRDGFLATEQGSKIGYEGQARLNSALDKFISSLGRSKELIQDVTINGKKYSASQVAAIEANRSAWEKFFSRLKPNQKKMLDFAVKTGRMNVKQLQEIWDYAAKEMQKTDLTAFTSIQDHIAQLRNTPDIVLNIVYKERTEKSKDPVIRDYTEHFLTPSKAWDADTYIKKEEELYKKYGTLIKKEGEDRVEWGERVFKTIHDEEKKAAEATKALAELQKELTTETKRAGDARYQAAKKQKKESEEIIKNAKEVVKYEKLHDKEKKKGKQKDPILDALKLETELVERLNAEYEGLMKNGAKSPEALASLHKTFGKTISQLNSQLKSFGLPQLDLAKILVGRNPKKQLEHFQKTLGSLVKNGLLNMERSKVVEAVIEKVSIRAENYDLTELSKGIEKELNKLKESFDLGTALDAEPQLGNLFAKMYGFDTKELPRTFTELVQKAQSIIDNAFKGRDEARIDVSAILDKNAFEEWVKGTERELDSSLVQTVQKTRDYLLETLRKMISDSSKTYDKLLERYSEYQFKLIKIDKDSAADRLALIRKFATEQQSGLVHQAVDITNDITMSTDPEERERLVAELQEILKQVAGDNRVVLQIGVGIDTRDAEQKAQLAFEEFTKNPEWQIAIGDLEGMTHKALRMLIKDLEDFMKTNKKLTPKQIRQIESTITKLHKQIRKNNPFAVLADAIEESKNRTKKLADEIEKKGKEVANIKLIPEDKRTKDDVKHIESLTNAIKKLKAEMKDMEKLNVETIVKAINDSVSSISTVTSSVTQMLEAIGHRDQLKAANAISTAMGVADAMGKGAQFGAQFGQFGAVIGAVAGGVSDLVNRFADFWSGNDKINTKIARSEREVKRLENAYADLEHQMKSAFGQGEIGANKLLIANKELQIAQLELQLELEKSRKKKNRDDEKIRDLQEQIATAKRELEDFAEDITESFLGISSVKDAVSSMIDGIINALKEGEDAMTSFNESWEEMCWNMIKQVVGMKILAPKFKAIFDKIDTDVQERGKALAEEIATKKAEVAKIEQEGDKLLYYRDREGNYGATNNIYDIARIQKELGGVMVSYEEWLEGSNRNISTLEKTYAEAVQWSVDDLVRYSEEIQSLRGDYELTSETMEEVARKLGLTLGDKTGNLSALQAGISAITEDTANALEAYMNGVSQQVYAHTELLTEIRDAVIAFNGDVTLGVQSQMLLQLQNNYILMQTMHSLMENWTVPSGNGIRVELMS